jgi:hypothetical protein
MADACRSAFDYRNPRADGAVVRLDKDIRWEIGVLQIPRQRIEIDYVKIEIIRTRADRADLRAIGGGIYGIPQSPLSQPIVDSSIGEFKGVETRFRTEYPPSARRPWL